MVSHAREVERWSIPLLPRISARAGCATTPRYWLVDDNWGCYLQKIEFQNLNLFRPEVIRELQDALVGFPLWSTIRVDVVGKEKEWPGMGIIIYPNEIFDELQRDYLPDRFKTMIFGTIAPPPQTQEQLAEKVRTLMKARN